MEFLHALGSKIFLNFYSFGASLETIFTLFVALFLLTLKDKSKSTIHMGVAFLMLTPFNAGYVLAAGYYDPFAAYHRWLTVFFVTPAMIHFAQWIFRFPENTHPRAARAFLVVQWLVSIGFWVFFVVKTLSVDKKFLFEGHQWDFDADDVSGIIAIEIVVFLIIMVSIGIWKTVTTKTKERWAVLQITGVFVISVLSPVITNVLSRGGLMDRGTHQTVKSLLLVLAYFLMVLIYVNNTQDRTSFMAKIIGISLVTFLVTMQGLSFYTVRDREKTYDVLRVENVERAVEGGQRNQEIEYVVRVAMNGEKDPAKQVQFQYQKGATGIPFRDLEEEFFNTAILERILGLSAAGYPEALRIVLANTPAGFAGYSGAILQELDAGGTGEEVKARVEARIASFGRLTLTQRNNISGLRNADFRALLHKHLAKTPAAFAPFKQAIEQQLAASKLEGRELKADTMRFIAPMRPQHERIYRTVKHEGVEQHHVAYMHYDRAAKAIYEVGFPYKDYRAAMHTISLASMAILGVVLIVVLGLFPLFFRGSLINPLNSLLRGVTKVNAGDLTVAVPIKVHDEIGFLAESFNAMVKSIYEAQEKLKDYANNLEEKVKERTRELNETLNQVHALKVQQDGDYFLTSLLQRPLNYNANKSKLVPTQFVIKQKKIFEFRNKHADLGGDICVTGNLRIGKPESYRRYIFAMNGDAMGKSMQGAGGSLVMGVVMNTILARSAKNNRVMDTTPEQWLTDVYDEVHGVFGAFNGSMVISSVMVMIDEESGEMSYFNAEHPFMVLYRNGHASFIEEELMLRKLGLESEIPFEVKKFQLEPGDVVIMGSDGRDDIDLTPGAPQRTINEDEFMFLRRVEEGRGDLDSIMQGVLGSGGMTDDLSLLRIGFQENVVARKLVREEEQERTVIDIDWEPAPGEDNKLEEAFEELFAQGRKLARLGKHEEALEVLRQAYSIRRDFPALNKILAVLTFKDRDYSHAIEILDTYLSHDPNIVDFWLYLSIAHKRIGENEKALKAALKVYELNPQRLPNLINLADLYQKTGEQDKARQYLDKALAIDPSNRQAQSLTGAIG